MQLRLRRARTKSCGSMARAKDWLIVSASLCAAAALAQPQSKPLQGGLGAFPTGSIGPKTPALPKPGTSTAAPDFTFKTLPPPIIVFGGTNPLGLIGPDQRRPEGDLPPSEGFKRLPESVQLPKGDLSLAKECQAAQLQLAALGRTGSVFVRPTEDEKQAELRFAESCLAPLSTTASLRPVASRIGRLQLGEQVLCTIALLDGSRAITARHCVASLTTASSGGHAAVFHAELPRMRIHLGPLAGPAIFELRAIVVPARTAPTRLVRITLSAGQSPPVQLHGDAPLLDFAVLELSRSVDERLPPLRIVESPIAQGTEFNLPAFYPGYSVLPIENETGIRHQPVGLCKLVTRSSSHRQCMLHGCATNQGASGAPILVDIGEGQLALAGIHRGATVDDGLCTIPASFNDAGNIAIQVLAGDLSDLSSTGEQR